MAAWASRSLRHFQIPATSFLGAQSKFRRWALTSSSVPHSQCSGASSNGFGFPRLWSSVRRKSSGQCSRGEQRTLEYQLALQNRERSEEHTSELQSQSNLVCRLLLEKKKSTLTRRR